ncbi:hypothetical protein [Sinomonas humi]|uniref:Yip1 domain-containing protein n=1 Tax=Sinomonas humi TaxID=1338436 RepID=A0A0B2AHV2_9MICC|nr:hypothetical protein [Sinomonas humi]KHL01473.1 hypothetical protein LK10_16655 [Sinomonas humi]
MSISAPEPPRPEDPLISVARVGYMKPEASTDDGKQKTPRSFWIIAYILIMGLVVARLPLVLRDVASQIPADAKAELGDERLVAFSTTVGGIMFVLVYAVIMVLYLLLAAFLDRRIIPTKPLFRGRWRVGMYFMIAALTTIPVHLASVVAQVPDLHGVPGYYAYFPLVAVAALVGYRRHWWNFAPGKRVLVAATAVALPMLISFG